jgi:hypothetical protein
MTIDEGIEQLQLPPFCHGKYRAKLTENAAKRVLFGPFPASGFRGTALFFA